jgi:sulfhydrogenase subunit alpha
MAKDHPELVQKALKLKKIGNELVAFLGGREIHPINVRVGGFYKVPTKSELQSLVEDLKWARDAAYDLVRWTGTLEFPDFEQDYEFVALRHPDEYPFNEGRLVSTKGLDIAIREYEEHFVEEHVEHSNALHSVIKGRGNYFVGPLARYNINFDKLPRSVQKAAKDAGLGPVCKNPFKSIIVRSIETLYACEEALRILSKEQLTWKCEQAIRNYDPCISCATHFLKVEIERE